MVISYSAEGSVVAKLKATTFSLGTRVKIGEYEILGAGEYDVASVHAEVQNLKDSIVYWLYAEDLHITFLSQPDSSISDQDMAASTDILVVELRSDDSPDKLKTIIKRLEPAYVFLIGPGAIPELFVAMGMPMIAEPTLKVLRTSLPIEGTSLIMPA